MSAVDPIRLPGKYVDERIVVSVDFARRLPYGVGLAAGTMACSAEVLTGVDASPGSTLSGAASIEGTKVKQLMIGGVTGVDYKLIFQVDTDEATAQRLIEEVNIAVEEP